ncbi:hypothetical protein FOL47_001805 [Perkinsus chesapeaki]|uniref:Sumo ligase n=2 Tax=Alveolata TaxID=33630 RepID=A0A7J6KT30_PERCH|nr:hypothetical protein FOL47_001805 [Perkinsus chesapeaki]
MGPASASEIATTLEALPSFTVSVLKDYCRHMNLKVSGRKAELVERIREAVEVNPDLLTASLVWPPLVPRSAPKTVSSKNVSQRNSSKSRPGTAFLNATAAAQQSITEIRDPSIENIISRMDPFWPLVADNSDGILGTWRIAGPGTYQARLSVPNRNKFGKTGARIWARMIAIPSSMMSGGNDKSGKYKLSFHHVWPYSFLLEFDDGAGIKILPPEHLRKRRDAPLDITECIPTYQTDARFKVTIQQDPKLAYSANQRLHYVLAFVVCTPKEPADILAEVPVENCEQSSTRIKSILCRKEDEDDLQISGGSDEIDADTRSLRLTCPLSYARMTYPARGQSCSHIQCFDLEWFIRSQKMMAAFNNRWKCAVCDAVLRPDEILIDGYLLDILRATEDSEVEEVFVTKSTAQWRTQPPGSDHCDEAAAGTEDTGGAASDGCSSSSSTASTRSSLTGKLDLKNLDMPCKRARIGSYVEKQAQEYIGDEADEVIDLCCDDESDY